MDITEMWKRFQLFVANNFFDTQASENRETILILWESPWLRIVFTRKSDEHNIVEAEVELGMPNQIDILSSDKGILLIDTLISHLKYLKKLSLAGYSIEMIPAEGLWIASATLDTNMNWDSFLLLQPPVTPI